METFWNFGGNLNVLQINADISEPKMVESPNCKALLTYKEGRGYVTNLILLKIGWIKICKGRLYNLVFVCFLRCLRYAPTTLPSVWLTLRHTGCQNLSSQDQAHWKKNWMQSIPIELTSSTSLYAEKYFGEAFKKLSIAVAFVSFSYPVSILARIVLEHLRKASSTLSPVFALVSRKMRSFSWANLSKKYFNC